MFFQLLAPVSPPASDVFSGVCARNALGTVGLLGLRARAICSAAALPSPRLTWVYEVGGDGELGVAQPLGDHLQVHAGLQGQARVGMAEVVELDDWETCSLGQRLEVSGGIFAETPGTAPESTAWVS